MIPTAARQGLPDRGGSETAPEARPTALVVSAPAPEAPTTVEAEADFVSAPTVTLSEAEADLHLHLHVQLSQVQATLSRVHPACTHR